MTNEERQAIIDSLIDDTVQALIAQISDEAEYIGIHQYGIDADEIDDIVWAVSDAISIDGGM